MSEETCGWPHYSECKAAEAIRLATIDACIEACKREYLADPVKDTSDEEYDTAIKHCIDALHALKLSPPQNDAGRGPQPQLDTGEEPPFDGISRKDLGIK
jgi:hypothetical protein